MKKILYGFFPALVFPMILSAQIGPLGGNVLCNPTNNPTNGFVLTATTGNNCNWQSAGSASVTEAAIANAEWLTSVAGTNAITGSTATTYAAYAAGFSVRFVAANTNTGATTLAVNAIAGPKNIFKTGASGPVALTGGEIIAGNAYYVLYDGTQFQIAASTGGSGGTPCTTTALSFQFNNAGVFGCAATGTYTAATGVWSISQLANGNNLIDLSAFTGTSPTGHLIQVRNAAGTVIGFWDVNAALSVTSLSLVNAGTAGLWTCTAGSVPTSIVGGLPANVNGVICPGTVSSSFIEQGPNASPVNNSVRVYQAPTGTPNTSSYAYLVFSSINLTDTANLLRNNAANLFLAVGTLNLSPSTVADAFRAPAKAGFTAGATGSLGFDTTTNNYHGFCNAADCVFPGIASAPTNGHCANYVVSGGNILLGDAGSACGAGSGASGQVNPACTFVTTATGCTINVASLAVPTANATSILTQCFTQAVGTSTNISATYTITSSGGNVATVVPLFSAAAAGGYCTANLTSGGLVNSVQGQTGAVQITPAASNGVAVANPTGVAPAFTGANISRSDAGTTVSISSTDAGNTVIYTSTSAVTVTIPQAGTAGMGNGVNVTITAGAGVVTLTPTTSTIIYGALSQATWQIQNETVTLHSDGTNYEISGLTSLLWQTANGNQVGLAPLSSGASNFWQISPSSNGASGATPVATKQYAVPFPAVLYGLSIQTGATNTATGATVCTIQTGTTAGTLSPSTVTFTIALSATAGLYQDTTHSVAVVAGTFVSVNCVNSGSAAATTFWNFGFQVLK